MRKTLPVPMELFLEITENLSEDQDCWNLARVSSFTYRILRQNVLFRKVHLGTCLGSRKIKEKRYNRYVYKNIIYDSVFRAEWNIGELIREVSIGLYSFDSRKYLPMEQAAVLEDIKVLISHLPNVITVKIHGDNKSALYPVVITAIAASCPLISSLDIFWTWNAFLNDPLYGECRRIWDNTTEGWCLPSAPKEEYTPFSIRFPSDLGKLPLKSLKLNLLKYSLDDYIPPDHECYRTAFFRLVAQPILLASLGTLQELNLDLPSYLGTGLAGCLSSKCGLTKLRFSFGGPHGDKVALAVEDLEAICLNFPALEDLDIHIENSLKAPIGLDKIYACLSILKCCKYIHLGFNILSDPDTHLTYVDVKDPENTQAIHLADLAFEARRSIITAMVTQIPALEKFNWRHRIDEGDANGIWNDFDMTVERKNTEVARRVVFVHRCCISWEDNDDDGGAYIPQAQRCRIDRDFEREIPTLEV